MDHNDDLIEALRQEGINPTPGAVMELDAQINIFAEILVDYWCTGKGIPTKQTVTTTLSSPDDSSKTH